MFKLLISILNIASSSVQQNETDMGKVCGFINGEQISLQGYLPYFEYQISNDGVLTFFAHRVTQLNLQSFRLAPSNEPNRQINLSKAICDVSEKSFQFQTFISNKKIYGLDSVVEIRIDLRKIDEIMENPTNRRYTLYFENTGMRYPVDGIILPKSMFYRRVYKY